MIKEICNKCKKKALWWQILDSTYFCNDHVPIGCLCCQPILEQENIFDPCNNYSYSEDGWTKTYQIDITEDFFNVELPFPTITGKDVDFFNINYPLNKHWREQLKQFSEQSYTDSFINFNCLAVGFHKKIKYLFHNGEMQDVDSDLPIEDALRDLETINLEIK